MYRLKFQRISGKDGLALSTSDAWRRMIIEREAPYELVLTAHDDGFRVVKRQHWRLEEHKVDSHGWSLFTLKFLESRVGWEM